MEPCRGPTSPNLPSGRPCSCRPACSAWRATTGARAASTRAWWRWALRSGSSRCAPRWPAGCRRPRPAAERGLDGRVRTAGGDDVTAFFERGAAHAVALAGATRAVRAVLKARSPSCGCGQIYDGSHQRALRDGDGVTAEALRAAGVEVLSEDGLGASNQHSPGERGRGRSAM